MRVTMWEAKAEGRAEGRAEALVAWVRDQAVPGARVYASSDRVVVIAPAPLTLPEPPDDLVERPPHAWDFEELTDDTPTA